MKAMIVAAGRGERLRPITDDTPKPLVQVKGKSLIVHHLLALAKIGVTDVVINVCYRSNQIMSMLGDGHDFGLTIHYSPEETMLGVGGGMVNARDLLGSQPFILISAEIFSDYPLENLRLLPNQLAHLVLVNNQQDHPLGDFGLVDGYLSQDTQPKLTYGGIAIVHPSLLQNHPIKAQGIVPIIANAIHAGQVSGEHYLGHWYNISSIAELNAANAE